MADAQHPRSLGALPGPRARRRQGLAELTRRVADAGPDEPAEPLAATRLLIDRLAASRSLAAVAMPERETRLFAYRAVPEVTGPLLRLHVVEAEAPLLRFLGRAEAGFEVLQVRRAGLQYHWRSDLMRAFDEQAPILGRLGILAGRCEAVTEHLVVPLVLGHRIRELRGWFVFDGEGPGDPFDRGADPMIRRSARSRTLRLPETLWQPDAPASALRQSFAGLRRRWRLPERAGRRG